MSNLLKFLFADDESIVSSVCEDPANQNQLQSHDDLTHPNPSIIFGTDDRFWFRHDRYNAIKRSIMSIDLQRLFSKPRDRINPQFARQTQYRKGFDQSTGVLYNLIDPDDLPIYRTVRDEDDVYSGQELQLSKEFSTNDKKKIPGDSIARSLSSNGKPSRHPSPHIKTRYVPPDLTFARGRHDKTDADKLNDSMTRVSPRNKGPARTRATSVEATSIRDGKDRRQTNMVRTNNSIDGSLFVRKNDAELMMMVETMKDKYIKNIEVIGSLYDEKKSMEKRIGILERLLQRFSRRSGASGGNNNDEDRLNDGQVESIGNDEEPESQSHDDDIDEGGTRGNPSEDRLSPDANFSPKEDLYFIDSIPIRPVPSTSVRPLSASRISSNSTRRFSISPSLQTDVDRYNQRMSLMRSKEREAILKEKELELQQRDKLMRAASYSSVDIQKMLDRQAQLKLVSDNKKLVLQQKLADEMKRDISAKERDRRAHLNKPVIRHDMAWKDYAAVEELKRKERIEERTHRASQAGAVSVSSSLYDIEAIHNSRNPSPARNECYKPFRAAVDPDKIVETLRDRQRAWDNKVRRSREAVKLSLSDKTAASLNDSSVQLLVKSMEDRFKLYEQKNLVRAEEKKMKENLVQRMNAKEEKKRFDRLMKVTVPPARTTHVAELRLKLLKDEMEAQASLEVKRKRQDEKKMKAAKEASAVVRTIVQQREYERKLKSGGFVELGQIDDIAAQKAADSRRQMREKLRKQRQDLDEAKRRQPSLIERFEQDQARRAGRDNALQTVASVAISADKKDKNNDVDDFDIFSDKEKQLLNMS